MNIHRSTIENTLLVFMLAFAPLALASVHTWAYCTLAILALIIFNLHFLGDIESFKRVMRAPESIGAMAFLAVSLFYIIPLPPALVEFLSPNTWNLWQNYTIDPPKLMTLSVYTYATMLYILKFVTYSMVFLVVVAKIQGKPLAISHQLSALDGKRTTKNDTPYYSYLQLGALCAVLSILFHSLSDFNLHIPANALYFTVMLAIVTGLSQPSAVSRQPSEDNSPFTIHHSHSSPDELTSSRAHELKKGTSWGKPDTRYTMLDAGFLNLIVNSIILIAFVIAVFGIVQKLSYNGKIYWLIVKDGGHFGPYINYDHYAGYMEMCGFLAIASFIGKISVSSLVYLKRWKDKVVWFSTKEANKTLMYLFFAVVMATALFMTTSRGGIMSFLGALAVLYFICLISVETKKQNRILMASALVVLLIVIMFAWVGPEATIDRFQALQIMIKAFISERAILSEIRPFFWQDTTNMIKDFPAIGVGLGDYSYIFPKYRTFAERWGFLQFAHNDYLQLIAEMGVVGGVFLCGFCVWYICKFRGCIRRLRENG